MRGLKGPETPMFVKYFSMLQEKAAKYNCVFFGQCEEGHDGIFGDVDASSLSGWLIPEAEADEFEEIWDINNNDFEALLKWEDRFCLADWRIKNDKIEIFFIFYKDF